MQGTWINPEYARLRRMEAMRPLTFSQQVVSRIAAVRTCVRCWFEDLAGPKR